MIEIRQVLSICITSTNTLSSLLAGEGTSIPAFQAFFNYVFLNLVYTSYTIYKYGFRKWGRLVLKDGWRFFILAFMDVEGNYFIVLAYRYVRALLLPEAKLRLGQESVANKSMHRQRFSPRNS